MESDFIRRRDALDLCGWYNIYGNHPKGYKSIHAVEAWEIASIESADVEEVIRCKDCKHLRFSFSHGCGMCALFNLYPNGDWYCASGEREEGAD